MAQQKQTQEILHPSHFNFGYISREFGDLLQQWQLPPEVVLIGTALLRAYNLALSRRAELQHRARRMQLYNLDGTEFIDLTLKKNDMAVGKTVQDVAATMPHQCILISIRRNGRVLIPHGNTIFQPEDHITAFVRSNDAESLHQCLRG